MHGVDVVVVVVVEVLVVIHGLDALLDELEG
jgi:hypothetical protein